MTNKDLLMEIGNVKDTYIAGAEVCRTQTTKKRRSFKKPLLMAAVLSLMVLLMGSAWMLFTLQDKVIDVPEQTGAPEGTQAMVALFGYDGNPVFTAARQWYDFTKVYDPDQALFPIGDGPLPFPSHYLGVYGCYTQEMADRVSAIAEESGLKLLSGLAIVQKEDTALFLDAIGVDSLHRSGVEASVFYGGGYFHPEGNFHMTLDVTLTGEDTPWPYGTFSTVHYSRKDCFDPKYTLVNLNDYEQWNHRLSDGTEILIAMGPESALLFSEQKDGYVTVTLSSSPLSDTNPLPTREALELLAEVYQFDIRPQVADWEGAVAALAAADEARAAQANAQTAMQYSGFADYLKSRYSRVRRNLTYGFADLNGDDEQELLIGGLNGSFENIFTLTADGVYQLPFSGTFYLCQDGTVESVNISGYQKEYFWHPLDSFFAGDSAFTASLCYDALTDRWVYTPAGEDAQTLSETEAEAILAAHPRLETVMTDLMDFPLSDGTTLEQYILANETASTEDERLALYTAHLETIPAALRSERSHYCLMDLNGDGIEDLLLGSEEHFRDALTVHNGTVRAIQQWCTMNLCKNGVLRIRYDSQYVFCRFANQDLELIEVLEYDEVNSRYNRSADGDLFYEEVLTENEFRQILERYEVVDLPMLPLSQFPVK